MNNHFIKILSLLLAIGLSWAGFSAVGETVAYYFDNEVSSNNLFAASSLDFSLADSGWTPVESEASLELGNSAFKDVVMANDGILNFQYIAETDNKSGDIVFCDGLDLTAKLSDEEMYSGSLTDFLSNATDTVNAWNYRIDMPKNFQNSVCSFDFLYKGWQIDVPLYESEGFFDAEKIGNTISSWGLRINKVYYDVASDRGVEYDNEWVEIYNQTNVPLDISGWQICDNTSCDAVPSSTPIPEEGFAVITGNSSTWAYWSVPSGVVKIILADGKIGNGLNNGADMLILKRPDGAVIDRMNWDEPDEGWVNYSSDVWNPGSEDVDEGNMLARNPNGHDTNQPEDFTEFGPPELNLIYPDQSGTLSWYWTYTYNIQWTAANQNGDDNDISIDIYYIKDVNHDSVISAGDTMHTIVLGTANDGLHAWKVPSGFLGYIWIKVIARGPENPMLTDAMTSGKIYDPFPTEMWQIDPGLVMQAMIEAGVAIVEEEAAEYPGEEIILDEFMIPEEIPAPVEEELAASAEESAVVAEENIEAPTLAEGEVGVPTPEGVGKEPAEENITEENPQEIIEVVLKEDGGTIAEENIETVPAEEILVEEVSIEETSIEEVPALAGVPTESVIIDEPAIIEENSILPEDAGQPESGSGEEGDENNNETQ